MSYLEDCWRNGSRTPPAKRTRSLCEFALGIGDGNIMPMPFDDLGPLLHWDIAVPPEQPRASQEASGSVVNPDAATKAPRLKAKSGRPPPAAEEALNRTAVLGTWARIVTEMGPAFGMNLQAEGEWLEVELAPYFMTRRTGTLSVHASAWRLFLKYADDNGIPPASLSEPIAYQYLQHLAEVAAPATRASLFLKSCNFAYGLCEFSVGNAIAISARCSGLAAKSLKNKRRRKQRNALKAKWLGILEQAVVETAVGVGPLTQQEGVVSGFFAFTTHARYRCSDSARIVCEPTLDEATDDDPVSSFLEAETQGSQVKTGNTSMKADLAMPVVALSRGISDVPWGAAWLQLRQELFLDAAADETLMPEPLSDGTFGEGRILPGQATAWLVHILLKLGIPAAELKNIGSHSCKATVLSIVAKAGFDRDTRRTLGGHATPGDTSVDVYSRDTLAAPLYKVGLLFEKIRAKLFDPDASRSGRWRRAAAPVPSDTSGAYACDLCRVALRPNDPVFRCDCGRWAHIAVECATRCESCLSDICKICAVEAHVCRTADDLSEGMDDDPSSSSDGEQAAMVAEEAEATLEADSKLIVRGADGGADAEFPIGGIFVHKVNETAHKLRDAHCTACGIPAPTLRYDFFYEGASVPRDHLCWRAGCAPWTCTAVGEPVVAVVRPKALALRKLK